MSDTSMSLAPSRPEFERQVTAPVGLGDVAKPLSFTERLARDPGLRRGVILVVLALAWELYAAGSRAPSPSRPFSKRSRRFVDGIVSGVIPQRLSVTLETLVAGYAIGLAAAALSPRPRSRRGSAPTSFPPSPPCSTRCPRSRSCRSRSSGSASGAPRSSS